MSDEDDNEKDLADRLKISGLQDSTKELLAGLTAREAKVLRMRFGIDMDTKHTLEGVGRQFDITRQRIREIEKKALRKLRNKDGDDPDDDGPDAA